MSGNTNSTTQTLQTAQIREEDVLVFEAGLLGFENSRRFIVLETDALSPIRILQSVDQADVRFLVLDSRIVIQDYNDAIPENTWLELGVTDRTKRLSLVVTVIGNTPEESTANLRAPLLINFERMTGRQVTLTDSRLSVTHSLVSGETRATALKAAAAGTRS